MLEATPWGTATMIATDLPPERASEAINRINQLARRLKAHDEARSLDQLRADVLLDLLGGDHQTTGRGVVDLRVDLTTLAGLDDHPGELAGYGPVIADIARQTADRHPNAEWRYTIADPSGRPIGGGTSRRRPLARQRRETETRYPTCVFPGCRMPATACDLDHLVPHTKGGPTTVPNLAPLCRHQQAPNGTHQWTSPLQHAYTTSGTPP